MTTREARRERNRTTYAELRARFDNLPPDKRDLVKAEFSLHRAANPALSWAKFLVVALQFLPAQ